MARALDPNRCDLTHRIGMQPQAAIRELAGDPFGIAQELRNMLEQTAEILEDGPQTAYETSLALWPSLDEPVLRRFALAETCAHAE